MNHRRSLSYVGALVTALGLGLPACSADEVLKPSCTPGIARDLGSLTQESPLCEGQTLVAALTPERALDMPLQLSEVTQIETCFYDDNGEAHQLSIYRGDQELVRVAADQACRSVRIDAGDYRVRITHTSGGLNDSDPTADTLHTRWETLAAASPTFNAPRTLRLTATSNSCPGCDLRNTDWPILDARNNVAGYVGNYAGALFGNRCTASSCRFGSAGVASDFSGMQMQNADLSNSRIGLSFGVSADDNFEKASFAGTSFFAPNFAGNFREASFQGASFAFGAKFGPGDFRDASILSATFKKAIVDLRGNMDARVVQYFYTRAEYLQPGAGIYIGAGDVLDNLYIDGAIHNVIWKTSASGIPLVKGLSAKKTTLQNTSIPCFGGGDVSGVNFKGAALTNVNASGCNLLGAVFDDATLVDVQAQRVNLTEASFKNVTLRNVNFTGSALTTGKNASLTSKDNAILINVNLSDARFNFDASTLAFDNLVAFNADLSGASFAGAQMVGANFNRATLDTNFSGRGTLLDRATFTNAIGGPDFSFALLRRTRLDGARFDGAKFTGTNLEGASFAFGYACGGTMDGTVFTGSDLTGSLIPAVDTPHTVDGAQRICNAVAGRSPIPTTSAQSYCPDGAAGPCSTEARWTPTR
jgi:uncharacterized protein YjbI with pentapeptide repeats